MLKGEIILTRRNVKTGQVIVNRFRNIVVNLFRNQEARLFAGDGLATRFIDRLEFGTSGTAEAAGDTTITAPGSGPVLVAAAATYPTDSSVKFTATLTTAQGNGNTFHEIGLRFVDGVLATRKAFDGMAKSAMWSFSISWTIAWVSA